MTVAHSSSSVCQARRYGMPSAASVSEQDYGLSTQQDANQCWSSIDFGLGCSSPSTLQYLYPDPWRVAYHFSALWLLASLIDGSLWYRPHCGTVYCVVRCCRLSCPGQLPDRASVKSGELQAGWNSVCLIVYVWLFLLSLEGLLGQLEYTFMICIQSTSRT